MKCQKDKEIKKQISDKKKSNQTIISVNKCAKMIKIRLKPYFLNNIRDFF